MSAPGGENPANTPIFFHVGYPKTGSTWLQIRVFPNLTGVNFWRAPSFLLPLVEASDRDWCPGNAPFPWDKIGTQPVLISWESLVGEYTKQESALSGKEGFLCAERLHALVEKARIIIIIRNQETMLDSLYRQYIHGSFHGSFEAVIENGNIELDYLFYNELIDHYQALFGNDAVYVGLFEELVHKPKQFVAGILDFMGVEPVDLDEEIFTKRVNRGISDNSLAVMNFINAHLTPSMADQAWLRRLVKLADAKILLKLSGRKPFVPSNEILDHYRPGNRALAKQLGLPLAKYGYPL